MLKLEKDYPGINELCKTFAKNLSKIKDRTNYNDYCLDLTYWTHHKLNRNEEVQLLKYFRNFDSLYAKESFENGEKEKHCNSAESINTLYEKYAKSCCTYFKDYTPFNTCGKYFKCDTKYKPYNLQSKLNCTGVLKTESTLAKVEIPVPVDYRVNSVKEDLPKIEHSPKDIEINYNELIKDPFYMASLSVLSLIGIFLVFFVFYKVIDISFVPCEKFMLKFISYIFLKFIITK
ncbi:VIR-like CYIR protein [Plasmodium cynomolgi strain B]|uniref:VIR-like CYIR protein n=1 Tax=Plasmodium cynomolgi (strain B) TaxID=1120755 RepID=K6USV1_PLACD|nr:VIR-like CYIR protein [Plasmodium cynomolgi strain B]GAB65085.1 VIR-like CYIR protein [Plasmodium cynomolgi strain B]